MPSNAALVTVMLKALATVLFMAGASAFSTSSGMLRVRVPSLRHRAISSAHGVQVLRAQFGWGKKASNAKDESVVRDELKQRLLNMCAASRQGIDGTGPATQEEFDGLVEELISRNPTPNPAESALMTGRWKMKWTTEKEILFCVEKGLFGLACSDVYQTVDAAAGTLGNAIEFTDQGFLKVQSTFNNPKGSRFEFKFQSCALKWRFLEVPLPPVGQGWGEQVYLDSDLRIQRDSRGDTLIATRV